MHDRQWHDPDTVLFQISLLIYEDLKPESLDTFHSRKHSKIPSLSVPGFGSP